MTSNLTLIMNNYLCKILTLEIKKEKATKCFFYNRCDKEEEVEKEN